jgi:DNA-binding CsgD family transcriptional regulator
MFTIQDETDLLPAIHDGPFEQPMWSTFLDRLRARTRADYAGVAFRPPGRALNASISLYSGRPPHPAVVKLYRDEAWQRDPFPYFELREERVYALSELISDREPSHQRYRKEILEPSGAEAVRVVRITEPGGVSAWLDIVRAGSDFTPADGALLRRIAPHFRQSLRAYAKIERQKAGARIATEMMERLNFGWIALDARGIVLEQSTEAARLLQHGAGLRLTRTGRLVATDPETERRLSEAIRILGQGLGTAPCAIKLSEDPWVDLLLVAATHDAASPTADAAVIGYIQGDNRSLADRHEQLADLFGLLPSEARFALALSRGLSIAEAAESLGLTIETGRNYSKKIYAKMGARGQADLIRFILTSVLALA